MTTCRALVALVPALVPALASALVIGGHPALAVADVADTADTADIRATLDAEDSGIASELSLGSGIDTSGTGYGVARLELSTALVRPSPPLDRRGIHMCSLDQGGCAWILTGLERDQLEGIGASATAELLAPTVASVADDARAIASGELWAQWAGWRVAAQAAIQPTGDLRTAFWRSGRGIVEGRTILDIPSLWSLGTHQTQLMPMPWHIALGTRVAYDDGETRHAGFDRDISVIGARVLTERLTFDLVEMSYVTYGVQTARRQTPTNTVTYGDSATILGVQIASLAYRFGHGITARADGGLAIMVPVAPFVRTGSSEHTTGPVATAPTYWGELSHETETSTLTLGGGAWNRLDPTGHAADAGHLGTVELAREHRRLSLRAELGIGKLRRILVGAQAPEDIAAQGTRMWMGRAAVAASLVLRHDLAIEATAWAERSDRDDPRWRTRATGEVTTRAGADVSAAWRFARKRTLRRPG